MTKGVSLTATTAKARDAVIAPAAPASKPGHDDQVDSFASLLDTAVPTKRDEQERDGASNSTKQATEREQSRSDDIEPTYLGPADLALAWLASRDLTPLAEMRSGKAEATRETTGTPPGGGTGDTSSAAADPPDSGVLVDPDGAPSGEDGSGSLPAASLSTGSPAGATTDVTRAGAVAADSSPVTPGGRSRDASSIALSDALGNNTGGDPDIRPGSSTPFGEGQDVAAAPSRVEIATSPAARANRRVATPLARDTETPANASISSGQSRERAQPTVLETDRWGAGKTVSEAPVTSAQSVPPPVVQPRPVEAATRPGSPAEANAANQPPDGAFVAENTELSAAISKAQRGVDGSYRVTAMLNPPSLGRVEATIKVNGESVEVAITPHTSVGHDALSRHLDELRRELASEHGEVHLSLTDSGGQPRRGNNPTHHAIVMQPSDEDDLHVDTHAPPAATPLHIIL